MFKKLIGLGLLFVFILIVGILGCTQFQQAADTGGREYYPNTDGYSWTYQLTSSAGVGGVLTYSWNGTTTIDSINVQKFKSEYSSGGIVSTSEVLFKVSDDDVRCYGTTDSSTTEPMIILDFPLEIGKSWYLCSFLTWEAIVAAQETVTVPAGSFSCFRVDLDMYGISPLSSSWYAKDVGIVKSVGYTVSSGVIIATSTLELTSKNF